MCQASMNTKISKHLAAGINQQNLRAFNHNLKQCRKGEVQGTYMCWAKSRSQHARFTLQIHPTFAAKKHSQELNTSGFDSSNHNQSTKSKPFFHHWQVTYPPPHRLARSSCEARCRHPHSWAMALTKHALPTTLLLPVSPSAHRYPSLHKHRRFWHHKAQPMAAHQAWCCSSLKKASQQKTHT